MTSPRTMPVDPQLQSEGPNLLAEKGTHDLSMSSNSDKPGGEAMSYGKTRMRQGRTHEGYEPSLPVKMLPENPVNRIYTYYYH